MGHRFRHVILPLSKPATFTVILLSFVGGLRRFDLIWTMTGGGPGFTTDVLASTVYKQYQAGFYGLVDRRQRRAADALVTCLVFPLNWLMRRVGACTGMRTLLRAVVGSTSSRASRRHRWSSSSRSRSIFVTAMKTRNDAALLRLSLPGEWLV